MLYRNLKKSVLLALLCGALTVGSAMPAAASKTEAEKRYAEKNAEVVLNEVPEEMEKETEEETAEEKTEAEEHNTSDVYYAPSDLKTMGVIKYNGYRITWYSEKVLPGPGLVIPGRHVDDDGYVCDENGYICVASRDFAKGTEIDLPFGKNGKVYDWCPSSGTLDIYVSW